MMDIDKYLDEIDRLWPKPGEFPTKEILDLCPEAVAAHPESSVLWYDWGILMERCSEDHGYTAEEFRQCFENSIRCDATNEEAYQELGCVLDVYFDEFDKAEEALRKAIEHGAGCESYYARARVLAEMGRHDGRNSTYFPNCLGVESECTTSEKAFCLRVSIALDISPNSPSDPQHPEPETGNI